MIVRRADQDVVETRQLSANVLDERQKEADQVNRCYGNLARTIFQNSSTHLQRCVNILGNAIVAEPCKKNGSFPDVRRDVRLTEADLELFYFLQICAGAWGSGGCKTTANKDERQKHKGTKKARRRQFSLCFPRVFVSMWFAF